MHRYTALALFSAMISGLPVLAFAGPVQEVVPADSFIAQHVASSSQLHQQISLDPVVRRRLARHFHTSAPAVTRYIQDNLVLKKLTVARTYRVYCISRDGREYTINSRLAAGTPVFVMRSTGQPVLKLACGNPMVAALPPVVTKVAAYHSPALAAAAPLDTNPEPVAVPLHPNGPVVVAMSDAPGVALMPTTKVAGFIGQLPAVHGGGGFPFGYLAAIPVIAVAASHHGSSDSTPSVSTTGTGTTGTGTTGTTTGTTGTGTTGTDTGTNTLGTTGTTDTGTTGTGTTGTGTTGTETTGTDTGTNTLGTNSGTNTGTTPVPEPSTPAAFAVGGVLLLFLLHGGAKRRRRIN